MYNLKLLVHIAFHYTLTKEEYIVRILENFKFYQLEKIDVVIDTNTEETQKRLNNFIKQLPFKVEIKCHNLFNPLTLTWTHREQMLEQQNNYDLFMYLEDDILYPWENLEDWLIDNDKVYSAGYIRGFLRVEAPEDGKLYSASFETSMFNAIISKLGDKYYFQPKYPYYASWVYNQRQMQDFIKSQAWIDGNCNMDIRARAATGMMWVTPYNHKIVLPLKSDNTIDTKALNYHLANNYYCDPNEPYAKITINNIIRGKLIDLAQVRKWHREIYPELQAGNYAAISEFYEQLIEKEPTILSHYYTLGLAYLLQGKEEEAQLSWLVSLSQAESSDDLCDFLDYEANNQRSLHNIKNAWLIRKYLQDIKPESLNNLLYLIYLELQLNIFRQENLTDYNLLEVLEASNKDDIYISLLLETFHELKELNIAEITEYISHCEAKFALFGIETSEHLVIERRKAPIKIF